MVGRLPGKVAIVTGASTGIGRAIALRLGQEGASVAVTDIDTKGGEIVADEICFNGGSASFVSLDVTCESDWKTAIKTVLTKFGSLSILVNNAGISIAEFVDQMATDDYRRVMAANVDSVFFGTKHSIPAMKCTDGGAIINISSIWGVVGMDKFSAYCASKGAVRLFTKAVALECARNDSGIRVNSVHPGITHTSMMEETCRRDFGNIEAGLKVFNGLQAMGRVGKPEEIASGVIYLASDEAKFVTGTELIIDGGYCAT